MGTLGPAWSQDYGFAEAFGLNDDPFSPTAMSEVQDKSLLTDLHKRPLRLDRDTGLERLFISDAGPFDVHLRTFSKLLVIGGYRRVPVQATRSYVFLVSGEQGTGKSTLVYALVRWLSECKEIHWNCLEYPPRNIAPVHRPELYDYLSGELNKTGPGEHCYLVIDDLEAATQLEATQLYQDYSGDRVLVMFLITRDPELLRDAQANFPVEIRRFPMRPLKPDEALRFVERRIAEFRIGDYSAKLGRYKLFPFLAEDLSAAVADKDGEFRAGPITLRVLATTLHKLMEARLLGDGPDLDLATLSPDQIADQLILLRSAYADLVVA